MAMSLIIRQFASCGSSSSGRATASQAVGGGFESRLPLYIQEAEWRNGRYKKFAADGSYVSFFHWLSLFHNNVTLTVFDFYYQAIILIKDNYLSNCEQKR